MPDTMQSNLEKQEIAKFLNISDEMALFSDIPAQYRKKEIRIQEGVSEYEVLEQARRIASLNSSAGMVNFLGNGIYKRIVPASVDSIIGRSEFLTAYTPYQAEMSQGVLQSLFEYQTFMSELTGMDASNSSMYDGFTTLGEAVRMAHRINERRDILIPENMFDDKLKVVNSYLIGLSVRLLTYRVNQVTGFIDLNDIQSKVSKDTSAIVVEMPNSYGIIDENVLKVSQIKGDALLIAYVDPISLGMLLPPGDYGADIVAAEGQQLGIHMNYGGPGLGILTFRKDYIRKSPGRIIGETVDNKGKKAYVMTLQTREQHIRREKATSNICTNQALMAIASAVYLSVVGPTGLKKIAQTTYVNSRKLKNKLSSLKAAGVPQLTGKPFSDVLIKFSTDVSQLQEFLAEKGINGGVPLQKLAAAPILIPNSAFFTATETTQENEIDQLVSIMEVFR